MESASVDTIPMEVVVKELLQSRYELGARPASWDEREAGIDVIRTEDGRAIKLFSEGGQSPPQPGWMLILRSGNATEGYLWTLYGMTTPH